MPRKLTKKTAKKTTKKVTNKVVVESVVEKPKVNIDEKIANAKYGMIAIDVLNANRGNRFIEYAVKKSLGLPNPTCSISMFNVPSEIGLEQINKMDFVLLPGSTILANEKNQGLAMNYLDKIKVPKFCVAASGWKPHFKLNDFALKHIDGPIGARDTDTVEDCKALGKDVIFVGCPTAMIGYPGKVEDPQFDIIGFARKEVPWQKAFFKNLKNKYPQRCFVASVQERTFEVPILKELTKYAVYYDNPADVVSTYSRCGNVWTGRLHGCLPGMAFSKEVMFFGNPNDSRFTLLSWLGVPINILGSDLKECKIVGPEVYSNKLQELKNNLVEWRKQTIEKVYN